MELHAPIPFPRAVGVAEDAVLTELDVAISMVHEGLASRVRVASVPLAVADHVAGIGAARAGAAGLPFRIDRSAHCATFTVGPRN